MPKLSWISDENLLEAVTQLLGKAKEAEQQAANKFGKNVIDPFSAIFEITGFDIDYDTWHQSETVRQAQKSLQNHVGSFHQNILGHCKDWQNLGTGKVIDLASNSKKIIAEVKNKYNTISGGDLSALYYSLDSLVMPKSSVYKDYTAYYVTIIPKKPKRNNNEFTPSDKGKGSKCPANKFIREIDGASFYALATGEYQALEELFDILPLVISEVTGKPPIAKDKLKMFFTKAYG